MNSSLPSLAGADWLGTPALQRVFDAIEQDGDELRAVGGAVRNSLIGEPVMDVDLCTTALPQQVIRRAEKAGLKAIPTGIDHGTVTVVSSGEAFEITTLREDVETFGRHAVVRFGRDWTHDAARRDFTLNALYCSADGTLHDPLGGLADCLARRVRFIGDASQRIREDYLRILRFFRMHASYGRGDLDAEGLSASIALRDGLRQLSAERIGTELKRLVTTAGAAPVVHLMEDSGILEIVTGGVARLADFEALKHLQPDLPEAAAAPVCLAALFGFGADDLERLAERLRLSNAERERMVCARLAADHIVAAPDAQRVIKALLVDKGVAAAADGLALAAAILRARGEDEGQLAAARALLTDWTVPVFPVTGRELIELGLEKGPALGAELARLRTAWADSDYTASRSDLLALIRA
jgi:poly(A) polymerase